MTLGGWENEVTVLTHYYRTGAEYSRCRLALLASPDPKQTWHWAVTLVEAHTGSALFSRRRIRRLGGCAGACRRQGRSSRGALPSIPDTRSWQCSSMNLTSVAMGGRAPLLGTGGRAGRRSVRPRERDIRAGRCNHTESPWRVGSVEIVTSRPSQAGRVGFESWLVAREHALQRTALLLTGDPHSAQDLVQNTLTKLYLAWDRIEQHDRIDGYARRVLVNEHRSSWRRAWRHHEVITEVLPDPGAHPIEHHVERDAVWAFVASLPPRQRAVIVLRYYEDLTEAETADRSVSPAAP